MVYQASMLEIVTSALPLLITRAEVEPDPILLLGGPGWAANLACDWLLEGDGYSIGRVNNDEEAPDEEKILTGNDLAFLIGRQFERITSNSEMIDPVFHISGGVARADSDIDPWVLGLPDITLVGNADPTR